jgi:hypothetical protein
VPEESPVISSPVNPNILMHSDEEMEAALGARIALRKTIREWPLSCVQELHLADGTKLAYKSQLPPTVEPGFYERASSRLLPGHRSLGKLGDCDTMIIDWIDAPKLNEMTGNEAELVEHGRCLMAQIGEIRGDLPVHLDIGSIEAWTATGQNMFDRLERLVADRRFKWVNSPAVKKARAWAASPGVLETVSKNPKIIHGDLKADQVFVAQDGYRLIDWQPPAVAPPEVDLATLLIDQHVDPRRYVDEVTVGIHWFLRLHWAVEAQFDLFPDRRWPLFDNRAAEAIFKIIKIPF